VADAKGKIYFLFLLKNLGQTN